MAYNSNYKTPEQETQEFVKISKKADKIDKLMKDNRPFEQSK